MPSHKLFGFQNHRENSCGQRPAFVAIGWSHKLGQDTIHQNYVWSLWLVFRHHSKHVNTCDLSDSLTRAVNLKRVRNLRFIYRIQWKVREFTWFIRQDYQPFTNPVFPALHLVRSSPGFQAPSAAAMSFCQYLVCPKPQSLGWWCKREGHSAVVEGFINQGSILIAWLFISIACIFFILSHHIDVHRICLFYNFQFRYCILAQASQPSQCIS